LLETREEKE
jgi:hypothetical protein